MAEEGEFMVGAEGADGCSELEADSDAWSRMVSVLGFVNWRPVHLNVGISTTVTLFKF